MGYAKGLLSYLRPSSPPTTPPEFYECGCCGAIHSNAWFGDCREDDARLNIDELDATYGPNGWNEVSMCEDE